MKLTISLFFYIEDSRGRVSRYSVQEIFANFYESSDFTKEMSVEDLYTSFSVWKNWAVFELKIPFDRIVTFELLLVWFGSLTYLVEFKQLKF